MSGVNKVIILGNVGQDPETRYLPDGRAVTNISIATSVSWKDKDSGQKKEKTEWHRCVAFGKPAEILGEYVKKGSQLYIEGSLQTRQWEKEGQKHYSTEISIKEFQFVGKRGSVPHDNEPESGQPYTGGPASDDYDDDIPF